MGGGQSAGATAPAVFSPCSDHPFPAHHAPQTRSYFLLQTLKSALEAFAQQGVQQRVDVRVQQHQPVRKGHSRGGDEAGLARDCSFCGLN